MPISDLQGPVGVNQYKNLVAFDKGGMGEVYLADDTNSGERVAIKVINLPNSTYVDLLAREVDVSIKLKGKNLVNTMYSGRGTFGVQEFFYIVQKFYVNGNLRKRIRQGIELDECIKMMDDLLDGLAVAHEQIVHRDLKPENILVSDDGHLLIADFGLAKYVEDSTKSKTFKGSGTYPYMAPECWTNQTNSVSMDIYSLGIIFFEILTGQLPEKCVTVDDWRDFHLFTILPDISNFRADVPVKLKQIILKMTQKRVTDRFKTAQEVKLSLDQAASQAKAEKGEVERLAQLAHSTIAQVTAGQLRRKELAEKAVTFQKILNYHATELFDNVKRLIAEINSKLVDHKIKVVETPFNGNITARKIELNFNGKSIYISFSSGTLLQEFEERRVVQVKNMQRQAYGMVMSEVGDSIFKQRKIILLGQLHCNHLNNALQANFGFNLLLVKDESEQYGRWYRASFFDSGFGSSLNRKEFSLREDEFLREFESCFAIHTMRVDYRELSEADLIRAIQEILV